MHIDPISKCRSCGGRIQPILFLGSQYLSDFRSDYKKPNEYRLELMWCRDCYFAQLDSSAPLDEMYTENYGFKSGINNTIKADLQDIVYEVCSYNTEPKIVLDIGSNDGTLLSYYPKNTFKIGIDPIKKLCEEAAEHKVNLVINDFFSADRVRKEWSGKFDAITAISMFYDVEDPNKLVGDMESLLSDEGVLVIQQNYILATLKNNAYDNICHEHIGYHSLMSMENILSKHNLEVVDVSTSLVNGGVLRTVIQKKGVGSPTPAVQELRDIELHHKLNTEEPYHKFAHAVRMSKIRLQTLLADIHSRDEKVYIYGASTRGGTIWQYCNLDFNDLPYAVDRNPEKVGKRIASIGVPIISEQQARRDNPEYMLVSIWFFAREVCRREMDYLRKGGKLIFPLPELTVVTKENVEDFILEMEKLNE